MITVNATDIFIAHSGQHFTLPGDGFGFSFCKLIYITRFLQTFYTSMEIWSICLSSKTDAGNKFMSGLCNLVGEAASDRFSSRLTPISGVM